MVIIIKINNKEVIKRKYLHVFIIFVKIKLFTLKEIKRIIIYNKIVKIINIYNLEINK